MDDSPAGRSHLEPGDYIIFIDKKNVVDKSKSEILSIINKSDSLTLEVFRRTSVKMQMQPPKIVPLRKNTSIKIKSQKSILEENVIVIESSPKHHDKTAETSVKTFVEKEEKKTKLVSKNSTESKKKQLVTFSKEEVTKNDKKLTFKFT